LYFVLFLYVHSVDRPYGGDVLIGHRHGDHLNFSSPGLSSSFLVAFSAAGNGKKQRQRDVDSDRNTEDFFYDLWCPWLKT
jgi:hypothetical protein